MPSTLLILMNATPQKMKPKKESKSEDINPSKSEKNGITSAMMKALSHVSFAVEVCRLRDKLTGSR